MQLTMLRIAADHPKTLARPASMIPSTTTSGDAVPVAARSLLGRVLPMALAWLPVAVLILIHVFAHDSRVATAAILVGNAAVLLQACALSWMLGLALVLSRPAGPHGVRGRLLAVAACVVPLPLFLLL